MYQRILVPIDGSPTSERGLTEAIALARMSGGSIRLLHVLDDLVFVIGFETGAAYLNTVLPQLRQQSERVLEAGRQRAATAGVSVETLCVECFARRTSDIVVEQAALWPADLIVLGTHGRRGVSRAMLGSDAEQVLRIASVPVLLIRSAEDSSRAPASTPTVPEAEAALAPVCAESADTSRRR